MTDTPNVLAVIPCKAASHRLPNKNTRELGGKPLFLWTIEAALASETVNDIVLSTDDILIGEMARHYGVDVRERPAQLAEEGVPAVDVVLDVLNYGAWGAPDIVLMLQPTSPFRGARDIDTAVAETTENAPVIGVTKAKGRHFDGYGELNACVRSNGAIYSATAKGLREYRSFYGWPNHVLYSMAEVASLEIDTELDWLIAEMVVERGLV